MNVAEFLKREKVDFKLLAHRDTYDAQRMAQSLHISGRHVAKTVMLRVNRGESFVVALLPANRAVDFELASQLLGGHVELASEREMAENCPDCEVGVLPPFGSQYDMRTIVDRCLTEDDEIVFEGNTHHEAFRMLFDDFRRIEKPIIGEFSMEP
jgi:Ala-tRNA(Pro) deacylase